MTSRHQSIPGAALRVATAIAVTLGLSGCGTARVSQGTESMGALPRPSAILVYRFAASPDEVTPDMGFTSLFHHVSNSKRTEKEFEVGRKLSAEIADELVKKIDAMALPATRASGPPAPGLNGLMIQGALVSINEGSKTERAVVGLGAGGTKLAIGVHVYELMPEGRRLVDSFQVDATGGWKPGAAEMAVVGIATHANPALMILGNVGTEIASEKLSSGIDATAKHAANQTAKVLGRFFAQHGWVD